MSVYLTLIGNHENNLTHIILNILGKSFYVFPWKIHYE